MRFFTWVFLLFVANSEVFGQSNFKTIELSHWETTDPVPVQWGYIKHNSCWGIAVNGKEYAIMGATDRIHVVDVTDAKKPVLAATFMGDAPTVWREFKSYKNRVYAVADASSEGLKVIDFSNAPNNIRLSYSSNQFFNSSHTITMDTTRGLIFLNSSNPGCIRVLNVKDDPDKPTLVGDMQVANCTPHDSYYENGLFYLSNGNNGLQVYDATTDVLNPTPLASVNTFGYNHSSCTDKSGQYLYYLEEIPEGRPGRVVDLSRVKQGEMNIVETFFEPLLDPLQNAIYHNPFRDGDLLHIGAYEDGLVVFDISKPLKPKRVAWFDPSPNTKYNQYTGVWSVYPWLPSGNIIVGDMVQGLYMVKLDLLSGTDQTPAATARVVPNPARHTMYVTTPYQDTDPHYRILSVHGVTVQEGTLQDGSLQIDQLMSGFYILTLLHTEGQISIAKFVKQ